MSYLSEHGLKAWAYDLATAGGTATLVDGDIHLVGMNLRFPTPVSTIHVAVTTAGATIANCFAGLYNEAGTRLGVSADQATPWAASTGLKSIALAGGAVDLAAGWYYVALLMGSGTTDVVLASGGAAGGATVLNLGLAAPRLRTSVIAGSATSLPATITTSELVTTNALNLWAAVS